MKLDWIKTELQERGQCRVATLSLAEVVEIVSDLGLEQTECFFDVSGWLYIRRARVPRPLIEKGTRQTPPK